jgi:methionyl-tRNA formyltransferase
MPLKIVFMGTPEFAVPCLRELVKTENVAAVFSKPDSPSGRGKKLTPSPVKKFAEANGIPCFTPASLRKGDEAEEAFNLLKSINPDLFIVTAYGQILPQRFLDLPSLEPRCINLHGSLLPHLRGAAPIERAVLAGDARTGVTSMVMAAGVDTGDMLLSGATAIGADETAAELRGRLSEIAATVMLETLSALKAGTLVRTVQDDSQATYAPMIDKAMSKLNFNETAKTVHNTVSAVTGYAFSDGKRLKIYRTRQTEQGRQTDKTAKQHPAKQDIQSDKTAVYKPGELFTDNGLFVQCGDTALEITELQPEGGKRVSAADFLRGHTITPGTVLRSDSVPESSPGKALHSE